MPQAGNCRKVGPEKKLKILETSNQKKDFRDQQVKGGQIAYNTNWELRNIDNSKIFYLWFDFGLLNVFLVI